MEPAIATFENGDTPVRVRIQPPRQEIGAPEKERGAIELATQERTTPDPTPAPHTYSLRDRGQVKPPSFNNEFNNPSNTKSYSATPHLQFFQQSMADMTSKPTEIQHHLSSLHSHITTFMFTQMTDKAGIRKHGQKAVDALFKEFSQIDTKGVIKAIRASDLTHTQRKNALRAINLIKEKRNGVIKGRTCADGRPERKIYTREEVASPTASNDSIMTKIVIAAHEKRKVVSWDVEGAYLLADQDKYVVVKFVGKSVDIMCSVNPSYKQYVVVENGVKVLYFQLLKALYGCLRSALLWYNLYVSILEKMGFKLNPYDHCVANKMINGKQCTIAFYVDDNLASHAEQAVLNKIIKAIELHTGKMTVTRGDKHTFLGMDITFRNNGTASISMRHYIEEALEDFPDKINKKATTPARKDLFTVDDDSPRLNEERAQKLHSITMKLMYMCQRSRPDIITVIAFLCTRVTKSTEQDWSKLKRLLEYLWSTIDDVLTLGAEDLNSIGSFVDVSFAMHEDMRSHTGGGVSFGRGILMGRSTKQKLNTTSSTESELVGAAEYLPNVVWLMNFLEHQGYETKSSVLYQDNVSAIRLEKNGQRSSSRRTRHIDIKYFWVKDRLQRENIEVIYCPTDSMVADFFTKPLQGAIFKKLCDIVMGRSPISSLKINPSSPMPEERVGGTMKPGHEFSGHVDEDEDMRTRTSETGKEERLTHL